MPKIKKTAALKKDQEIEAAINAKRFKKKAVDSIGEFYSIIRLFAHLIKCGTSPQDTIALLAQGSVGIFKEPLEEVKVNVDQGFGISESFAQTDFFPHEFISILRVGQNSGKLGESLLEYGKYLNSVILAQKSFGGALKYPVMMINVTIMGTVAMMLTSVPNLKETVDGMIGTRTDVVLPIYTKLLFGFYDIFNFAGTPGMLLITGALCYYLIFGKGKAHIMLLLYKIPKVGALQKKMQWAQWLTMASICLGAGMTIPQMLFTMESTDKPKELSGKDAYRTVLNNVKYNGSTLGLEFARVGVDKRLTSLISIAEKKGQTRDIMYEEANDIMQNIPFDIDSVKQTLNTVSIAVVTSLGGSVVVCVMLTIIGMSMLVQ